MLYRAIASRVGRLSRSSRLGTCTSCLPAEGTTMAIELGVAAVNGSRHGRPLDIVAFSLLPQEAHGLVLARTTIVMAAMWRHCPQQYIVWQQEGFATTGLRILLLRRVLHGILRIASSSSSSSSSSRWGESSGCSSTTRSGMASHAAEGNIATGCVLSRTLGETKYYDAL
jgi:hypothetical protein